MSLFTGSGVAIVTPFNSNGSINYEAFEKMINFQIENKTDAIIVCGTTGEASTLNDDEHIEAVKFVVDTVKKRIPVIAGAGSNYTSHGVELCKRAEKAGADGLLIVTPYYNKTTQKGLVTYYKRMAGSTNLPVIMYSVKTRTSLNISPAVVKELADIENIVGIKEASSDVSQVAEIASICGDKIDIYSGCDDLIVPILSLGGKGVISVLANVAPKNTHDMVMKYLEGDTKEAKRLQLEAMELISALFCEVNPIPVKKALNFMGMNAGGYREPLVDMEETNAQKLKKAMQNYGLI